MLENFNNREIEELLDIGWLTASDGSHRRIQIATYDHRRQYCLSDVGSNHYSLSLSALLDKDGIAFDDLRRSWVYHGVLYNNSAFIEKLTHDRICPCLRCVPTDFIAWCKAVVSSPDRWVVADTETTGLKEAKIDIVDLAILGTDGTELYNSILRPVVLITADAMKTHNINEAMAAQAPLLEDEWTRICQIVGGRTVITWNTKFDQARIEEAMRLHKVKACSDCRWVYRCAMTRYSDWYNEPNRKGYKNAQWQNLSGACLQQGITLDPTTLHRAMGDCKATLQLIRQVALVGEDAPRYGGRQ